uniref:protein POLR1D-like n=1 Tax=Doryrhamphus excisus TaxID=161450 RepID=UPI0025ADE12C|nr:protein POLR1D-like [Doryrhamphus excisus]
MTKEENELEKRAIEELLRETDRARLRAETMGPAGWLKCPLRSTNKRFLLNTLRSTGLERRPGEPKAAGHASMRGHARKDSPERSRSRSPARRDRGHSHKRPHRNGHDGPKEGDRGRERSRGHKDKRGETSRVDGHKSKKDKR